MAALSGFSENDIVDFSASINPLGPPEWFPGFINSVLPLLEHYPDPQSVKLKHAISRLYDIPAERLVIGNGSTELFYALPKAAAAVSALIPVPSYGDYGEAAEKADLPVTFLYMSEADGFCPDFEALDERLDAAKGKTLVFLGRPNNPTGLVFDKQAALSVVKKHARHMFCMDEAFADFIPGYESFIQENLPNVAVSRSLTKFYAVPGLRIGWMAGPEELIKAVKEQLPPWSVNTLAQEAASRFLEDRAYFERTLSLIERNRAVLMEELASIGGIKVYPGRANYLLCRLGNGRDGEALFGFLLKRGIAIRRCANFEGLTGEYFRIAVRDTEENRLLTGGIRAFMQGVPWSRKRKRKPAIMLQGTSSNAGKSLMAAAFCRILLRDGYQPAPFKAQNMALNSFVTREGGEMGRAQVVQAQACRLSPEVRMNPVLLKPGSDTGSQVIVMGKPIDSMEARAYYEYKDKLINTVHEAYDSLASEFEVMVLEGAGSPAEVNLKDQDIVNMAMARYADSPVLLVGDIDRGGLFASFIGTMQVLTSRERDMVAGFIINKFRGDADLLAHALDFTFSATGKKILGVVPYIRDLSLPEEDSVTFKEKLKHSKTSGEGEVTDKLRIWVIDLPHISNFTDFDAFAFETDVELTFIGKRREMDNLPPPHCLILPGTKNVMRDMDYLTVSGIGGKVKELFHAGQGGGETEIVGICGGYQMLGSRIEDPYGVESAGGLSPASPGSAAAATSVTGLGLLDCVTFLEKEKTLTQSKAVHGPSSLEIRGYEIHHGRTRPGRDRVVVTGDGGDVLGTGSANLSVWGTYLHGLFDNDGFRRWFLDSARERNGLGPVLRRAVYDIEAQLDRLAQTVRESVDMPEIYRIMGLK